MSQPKAEKSESKRSRLPAQSSGSADANPTAASRASIPVAETRYEPTHDEIEQRAYSCWHERGCPDGSPDVDWNRAEEELRKQPRSKAAATSS